MSRQTNPNPAGQANMILVMVLTGIVLFGWPLLLHHFWPNADKSATNSAALTASGHNQSAPQTSSAPAVPTREGGLITAQDKSIEAVELDRALASGGRIPIVAPGLSGSINLSGGVIDDLTANHYKASLAKSSGPVRLFSPARTLSQEFAQFGWMGDNLSAGAAGALPDGNTLWQANAGARLTPASPVKLSWTNTAGDIFALTYMIDADYMITVTQTVTNGGKTPLTLRPFALIDRTDRTASMDSWTIHSGPFGAFDGAVRFAPKYKNVASAGIVDNAAHVDWLGFTDIYWMSVLIPDAMSHGVSSNFRAMGDGDFVADLTYRGDQLAPAQSVSHTTRLFAGAKESEVLDRYEAGVNGQDGVTKFGHAIDWGWFFFVEKPIFGLLRALFHVIGNFGLAIIALTLIVRGAMFPIAQRQFASMAAMRVLQPKMKALQERFKDDKAKLQEETMRLYKEEGVNPLSGCLPVFLQIPVFFALYKVLMVAIDMRQAPFVGWIRDLSVPDPLHIFNVFGLLPFTPPSILALGPLGLMLGITGYIQFRLQPQQADPAQQQVMGLMPWMMMFILSSFASGLLIYYITSNILTIAQQMYLYSKHPQLRAQASKSAADAGRARK